MVDTAYLYAEIQSLKKELAEVKRIAEEALKRAKRAERS